MFDWVWLSRVVLLGLTGTVTLVAASFSGKTPTDNTKNSPQVAVPSAETRTKEVSLTQLPTAAPTKNSQPQAQPKAPNPVNLEKSLKLYSPLFATPTSLGMLAIGTAEGNYRVWTDSGTIYVQQNPSYFGHTDPGNLSWGDVVTNYGPCSDQGRSGGNIAVAEQICVERSQSMLSTQIQDLSLAGINPDVDLEAVLNTADLYNQASPIHSRRFPQALAMARSGGLQGIEALSWARTASFYLNGKNELDVEGGANQANGLIGICARQQRPITEWECVYEDQQRRVEAIAHVLAQYQLLTQQKPKAEESSS